MLLIAVICFAVGLFVGCIWLVVLVFWVLC